MRLLVVALVLPTIFLAASGCCGGYAVVRTTVASGADSSQGAGEAGEAGEAKAYVLHYSRLGEPPGTCDEGRQYLEDLFVRLPSLRAGEVHTLGGKGVRVLYSRRQGQQEGPPSGAKQVTGTIRVIEIKGEEVVAELDVKIMLASGDVVELDDEYTFHPDRQ